MNCYNILLKDEHYYVHRWEQILGTGTLFHLVPPVFQKSKEYFPMFLWISVLGNIMRSYRLRSFLHLFQHVSHSIAGRGLEAFLALLLLKGFISVGHKVQMLPSLLKLQRWYAICPVTQLQLDSLETTVYARNSLLHRAGECQNRPDEGGLREEEEEEEEPQRG